MQKFEVSEKIRNGYNWELWPEGLSVLAYLPEHTHAGLARYIFQGRIPGSFLISVITRDFHTAILHADDQNLECIRSWAIVVREFPPGANDPHTWKGLG